MEFFIQKQKRRSTFGGKLYGKYSRQLLYIICSQEKTFSGNISWYVLSVSVYIAKIVSCEYLMHTHGKIPLFSFSFAVIKI